MRSSDRSHHFFSLFKKKNSFEWTPECQHALEELKRYLSSPPLLHTPKEDETLYLYLAVSEVVVSGVLVREEQDPKESRALRAKAARFSLDENGTLYRRTFDGHLAVCLGPGDTDYVLQEIHEGTCGNHSGADSLVRKAESTNKTIIQNLKKRLENAKGKWREVLPEVLWAYRTTSKSTTGETPFSLVYGSEALIPVKVGEPSARFRHATEDSNGEAMTTALELLDEKREAALVRMAAKKQRIERYYNRRTNLRYLRSQGLSPNESHPQHSKPK
uniref:Uncharacterized protein LOC104236569 n=1 Tax=Nicotiana sylvestris TaxID=4096 RepID=A0A1U7X9N0_NICSY|nr:PREDICTED: uncharacterized protein LOC104236569 [Nicotiana sylvestris]